MKDVISIDGSRENNSADTNKEEEYNDDDDVKVSNKYCVTDYEYIEMSTIKIVVLIE